MELWVGQKHPTSTLIHSFAIPFLLHAIKKAVISGKNTIITWSLNLLLSMIKLYSDEQDELARRKQVGQAAGVWCTESTILIRSSM